MKRIAFAVACAVIAASASAAPENYSIDPTHSAARFGYDHLGWTYQQHRFDQMTGKIVYDKVAHTGSVDVTIDAKSLNTGYALFTQQMQAEDMFDTAKYPTITYKSTGVKFEGDKLVAIDGELTVKGITKPVSLTVTSFAAGQHPVQKRREGIGANAIAKIKRSDFGIAKQVPVVADEVTLTFTVQAFKD
ncbi:YceI family protein [Uliginosibacterium sp. H3]|uniref:YceI family protein n=1 Tax=Uliginosibacterium silvisoli TaxID=3114758 RepID=A0ABU6K845_9RHOO|nr:YceI family protein [Uliginosibacterium sp. H3]